MVGDTVSQTSSLVSNERQLVLQLLLTTLSGEELQVIIDLQGFDRLDEFETAVLEQLPTIGGHSAFGSELAFVHKDTGEILTNPIWDTLRDCTRFHLVVRQCFSQAEHKGAGAPPCLYTHDRCEACASRRRNTYHWRGSLAALQ